MDVNTAYAVLRLKPESSLDEAGKVFDAQAIRLDPERVKRSLRPAAVSKMTQVNDAWDVVRGHLESGGGPVNYEVARLPEPSHRAIPTVDDPRPVDSSPNPVAGWHVQPDGRQRYWDGEQWTGRPFRPALRRMSFTEAMRSSLTKYVGFSGRARRSEFWWFELFILALALGVQILDDVFNAHGLFQDLILLVMLLPCLAVSIRRLHDTNRSGWFLIIGIIPLIGGIILLVFECEDSGEGPNRYGPSPKYT
jgi:uncharacterized membrane protein YhaH (DUF805 family)